MMDRFTIRPHMIRESCVEDPPEPSENLGTTKVCLRLVPGRLCEKYDKASPVSQTESLSLRLPDL